MKLGHSGQRFDIAPTTRIESAIQPCAFAIVDSRVIHIRIR